MSSPPSLIPLLLAVALAACAPAHGGPRTLEPYRSEAQFVRALDTWRAKSQRLRAQRMKVYESAAPVMMSPPPPAPAAPMQLAASAERAAPAADESITNNQVQGVDEGDIVKRRGDLLIVLRRGRLFTLRIGGDRLDPVASADAFGPDVDPSGSWYDEMLVSDDTVAVIGYSYARGGTEVGLFDLDARGELKYRATYQLRSHDYYSARNYASRLVGRTLVFYSPMHLGAHGGWDDAMPAFRRWQRDAAPSSFRRMLPATRIYRGLADLDAHSALALHTVSVCDLAAREMQCRATAVLGPSGRVFHVAEDAVYVWTTGGATHGRGAASGVFRLPLDGGAPTHLRTQGSPVDQMGFLQRDGHLNVLVQREGAGEGMWNSGRGGGDLALLRVPLAAFGGLDAVAPRRRYRALPGHAGWGLQNRFVGDWLLYGAGSGADPVQQVHALRYAATTTPQSFGLPHRLERIEALDRDGLLVGTAGSDLHFTPVRLDSRAALAAPFVQRGASQGDDRTHGFFYRPTAADEGMLGLPILREGGAGVLYLRNRALALSSLGTLDARRTGAVDDGCRASCVDWYGNARPIFIGERVFALLGYELVEGRVEGARIRERRRVDFTPAAAIAD